MSLKSSRVAGFLSGLLSIATSVSASYAQTAWNYDRIVSCTDDPNANSITMNTMKGAPIAPPTIQYLPGPNGHTMMVADFAGLSYMMPPHIIHPALNPTKPGIEEIRIGQFQANPPICRVAAMSQNPSSLKGLSFSSNSGALVVKWTGPRGLAPEPEEVAAIPEKTEAKADLVRPDRGADAKARALVSARESTVKTAKMPPSAPPRVSPTERAPSKELTDDDFIDERVQHIQDLLDAARRSNTGKGKSSSTPAKRLQARAVPAIAPEQNNKLLTTTSQDQANGTATIRMSVPPLAPARSNGSQDEAGETSENPDLPAKEKSDNLRSDKKNEKPPGVPMARLSVVSDTGASEPNAAVQLLSERNIIYKSFRLHAPERYVIDLEKPDDLDEATVSLFQDNALCRSVRIGLTDKKTCRLVFDLASEAVQVQEKTYAEDGKVLTLKITSQPAPVTTKSGRPLEGVSLVLDAGHGGSDPGAQRGDAQEKEMTLGIVNQLKKRLEANGAFITMTRSDDTFVSLEDRVKVTNLVMPKAFVSVHINALESTSDIKGIETYFQTEQSRPLAEAIHNSLFTSLGVPNRGIRKARFYVINHTSVPAILAEVGYISNKDEREKLISSDYQGKVADALAQGVILYVGKSPEMPESTVRTAPAINANQRLERGTSAGPAKSVAASLSGSGASAKQ